MQSKRIIFYSIFAITYTLIVHVAHKVFIYVTGGRKAECRGM